jgi:hypothetical protein
MARTGFCGPSGALNSWADALATTAAKIAIVNVFMFPFRSTQANVAPNHACTQYIFRWIL